MQLIHVFAARDIQCVPFTFLPSSSRQQSQFSFPWASFESYLHRMQKQTKTKKHEENEDKFLVN